MCRSSLDTYPKISNSVSFLKFRSSIIFNAFENITKKRESFIFHSIIFQASISYPLGQWPIFIFPKFIEILIFGNIPTPLIRIDSYRNGPRDVIHLHTYLSVQAHATALVSDNWLLKLTDDIIHSKTKNWAFCSNLFFVTSMNICIQMRSHPTVSFTQSLRSE